jgi:hypothetical protein
MRVDAQHLMWFLTFKKNMSSLLRHGRVFQLPNT